MYIDWDTQDPNEGADGIATMTDREFSEWKHEVEQARRDEDELTPEELQERADAAYDVVVDRAIDHANDMKI